MPMFIQKLNWISILFRYKDFHNVKVASTYRGIYHRELHQHNLKVILIFLISTDIQLVMRSSPTGLLKIILFKFTWGVMLHRSSSFWKHLLFERASTVKKRRVTIYNTNCIYSASTGISFISKEFKCPKDWVGGVYARLLREREGAEVLWKK